MTVVVAGLLSALLANDIVVFAMTPMLIAGLKGAAGRRKVYKLVGSVQRAAEILPLPEDRLVAMIEAADVLGSVGAARKRALLLWQAVELSKHFGFPEEKTLAVARRALEHPGDEIA